MPRSNRLRFLLCHLLQTIRFNLKLFLNANTACSIRNSSLILISFIYLIFIFFLKAKVGHRNQYCIRLWRHGCLSYEWTMLEAARSYFNCSNKAKMPKSFMPIENMNVKKFRFTKLNTNKFSQGCLKWVQRGHLHVANSGAFFLYDGFCNLLIITKDYLIDS